MSDFGQANEPVPAPNPPAQSGGDDLARLINDAKTSMKARDYEAAKLGFRGVYDALARRGLGEGLEAMDCLADLGATHMALKEYDMALLEYGRLASIMERNLGEANAELRQHLRRYAQACDVCGRVGDAKQLYGRANDLERRYGQPSTRSHAGGLPQLHSGNNESASGDGAPGSTFTNAIQDAVARSMARLENTKNSAPGNPAAPAQPFGSVPSTPASPFAHVPPTYPKPGSTASNLPAANATPVKTPFQSLSFITPNPPPPNPFDSSAMVAGANAQRDAEAAAAAAAEEANAAAHSPGYRRASAEWQLEVGESFPSTEDVEVESAESSLTPEMHPGSDSSKAMAQWMVPINKGTESIASPGMAADADRRLPRTPASDSTEDAQKPFDRRQKPKSMKNLRSRFGDSEPPPAAPDEESPAGDAPSQTDFAARGAPQPLSSPDVSPDDSAESPGSWWDPNNKSAQSNSGSDSQTSALQNLGSLQTGSHSNNNMPALPAVPPSPSLVDSYVETPEPAVVILPPDMPPPPPPRSSGRHVQLEIGLENMPGAEASSRIPGSSTEGDYAVIEDPTQAPTQTNFGSGSYLAELDAIRPELKVEEQPPSDGEPEKEPPQRPSSMFSRIANKRVQDATGQGMPGLNPNMAGEEGTVNPRIRSMVDAARANSAEGKFADAARLLQKVVNELAESGLKDSRYIADCMLLLSEAYEASGQIGPAVTSFHQHALMSEKRVGEGDYENIGNWYRLAILLDKADERADATSMYLHAISLAERHLEEGDELTASIKAAYEEFLTQPPRSQRVSATSIETISPQEVLAQNKELRSSAVLQKQTKPTSKKMVVWSSISVVLLIAALTWFVVIMGQLNSSTARIDTAANLSRDAAGADVETFANTDGDGIFRFANAKSCDITVDGQVRRVPVVMLQNSISDILTMFSTVQAKRTFWVQKTDSGMQLDSAVTFFKKDSPELAIAAEMRRIGQHVEDYYALNRSYPRFRQDWQEDPQVAFINPITRRGEPSIFHVFPRSATPQALFGGSSNSEEIIAYLEKGNTWIGEPLLKPCSISCAVKQSSEKSLSGKPVVFDFYMHATDTTNKFLPASKPGAVSVVVLNSGQNLGNFDLHPKDMQKVEVSPMPDAVAYISMTDAPLFTPEILKSAVPVIVIGIGAIAFFAFVFGIATSKNNKRKSEGA